MCPNLHCHLVYAKRCFSRPSDLHDCVLSNSGCIVKERKEKRKKEQITGLVSENQGVLLLLGGWSIAIAADRIRDRSLCNYRNVPVPSFCLILSSPFTPVDLCVREGAAERNMHCYYLFTIFLLVVQIKRGVNRKWNTHTYTHQKLIS